MEKEIKFETTVNGIPLIKFQNRETIQKIRKGSFYMNSLKIYRKMYRNSGDNIIGDPYEGKIIIHDGLISVPEKGIINEPIKDKPIATANEDDFVFCMFGVNIEKYQTFQFNDEQKKKLIGTYDTALMITDTKEFFRRIKKKANEEGRVIRSGFVHYYNEKTDDIYRLASLVQKGVKNVVFYKRNQYEYQQEFRFTTENSEKKDSCEINIGDISDISEVFSAGDAMKIIMKRR